MEPKRAKTPNSGRKAGTPNKTTKETKQLLQKIVGKELEKIGSLLTKLEPIERINAISKLLPYILPKQNEIKAEITTSDILTPEDREKRIEELIAKANKN
jgi:F0F1-type ATP synthase delta subunit